MLNPPSACRRKHNFTDHRYKYSHDPKRDNRDDTDVDGNNDCNAERNARRAFKYCSIDDTSKTEWKLCQMHVQMAMDPAEQDQYFKQKGRETILMIANGKEKGKKIDAAALLMGVNKISSLQYLLW